MCGCKEVKNKSGGPSHLNELFVFHCLEESELVFEKKLFFFLTQL